MNERKALRQYKVEGRVALLERVSRGARTAVDTLISAAERGDIRASEIILKKVLPDLKAVDITNAGDGVKIIINQKIYPGRPGVKEERVDMPSVSINITEGKKEYKEIDITESVKVSEPPSVAAQNHSIDRKKGVYR